VATGTGALAIGANNTATGNAAIALGNESIANGDSAIALGDVATAGSAGAVALGRGATANQANAVALGAGAKTTRANQVVLGGTGSSVSVGDVAASTAAQSGPTDVMTVDAGGTMGRDTTIRPAIATLQGAVAQQATTISAIQALDTLQNGRLGALEAGQAQLGQQIAINGREANGGIAAAMAMGGAVIVPDSNVSINFNLATYRGQQGFSASVAGRINDRLYITAGVAGSTVKGSTGGRVGMAFGF
jgi:hypothetical protein